MTDKEKYYKMAEDWAEQYLKDNTEPKQMPIKLGHIILNHLFYLNVSLERLRHAGGREQQAAYRRIREFKNFVQK
jgi:hypothetical protein